MSKITLEPNSSGAGTFSIVSPDSNTNRTLNLPDEAGKLLSTGNDDPAEVFKQSNILGTVSESSGVPTGAIIERGSNSNGEFVKYADGTLICTKNVSSGEFTSDVSNMINFGDSPHIFINTDYSLNCSVSSVSSNASYKFYIIATNQESTVSSFNKIQLVEYLGRSHVTTITVSVIAIGRWY